MAVADYALEPFDQARVDATTAAWRKTIAKSPEDFSEAIFEHRLGLLAEPCDYAKGTDFYYGIFKDGKKEALAITEITYQRQSSKWIKMLNLYLSPDLDLSVDKNQPLFTELAEVFSSAIVGTLRLTGVHKSRVIKLYARTTVLLSFFEHTAKNLPQHLEKGGLKDKIKLSIEGRWLVLKIS